MHNKNMFVEKKIFWYKNILHFSTKYKSMYTSYKFTWGQISLKNKSFTTFQRTLNHCRKRNLGLRCQSFCTVGNFSRFSGYIFCKEIFIIAQARLDPYNGGAPPPPPSIFQNEGKTWVLPVLPHMAPLTSIFIKDLRFCKFRN